MDTTHESRENSSIYKTKPLHHLKLVKEQRKSQDCPNSHWFYLHLLEKMGLGKKITGFALKGGFMKREKVSSSGLERNCKHEQVTGQKVPLIRITSTAMGKSSVQQSEFTSSSFLFHPPCL